MQSTESAGHLLTCGCSGVSDGVHSRAEASVPASSSGGTSVYSRSITASAVLSIASRASCALCRGGVPATLALHPRIIAEAQTLRMRQVYQNEDIA